MNPDPDLVDRIRGHSRRLVREFGLLQRNVAGTDLSVSSVHALIEIGARDGMTARLLSQFLRLEKSSVSRLLKALVDKGLVQESPLVDGRAKGLGLTPRGHGKLAEIEAFATAQVERALASGAGREAEMIEVGLGLYADALEQTRQNEPVPCLPVTLEEGYAPGLCGRTAELHARYYNRLIGFGLQFETLVAGGMAEFLSRIESPKNNTWRVERAGQILGGVSIDGEDLGENIAHLRWFFVDDAVRGRGMGHKLMQAAMAFCREGGFDEVHLWTFSGLDAARALYERHGFELVDEWQGDQWGKTVREQKFVCRLTS